MEGIGLVFFSGRSTLAVARRRYRALRLCGVTAAPDLACFLPVEHLLTLDALFPSNLQTVARPTPFLAD